MFRGERALAECDSNYPLPLPNCPAHTPETMFELTFLYEMMWKSAVETTENALDTLSALCMPTPLTVEMTNEPVAPVIVEAFFPIAESEVGIVEELVPVIVEDFFPIEIGADEPVAPVTAETSVPIVEPAVESAADEIAAVDADEDEEYAAIRTEFADIRSWITTYLLETETNAEIETETETEPEIESANEIAEPTTIVEVPRAAEEIVVPAKTTMTPANEENECCSCTLTCASGATMEYASKPQSPPHDAARRRHPPRCAYYQEEAVLLHARATRRLRPPACCVRLRPVNPIPQLHGLRGEELLAEMRWH
ncbi:hypothetical protein FI667_g10145, partial [Globisporangium splendens]